MARAPDAKWLFDRTTLHLPGGWHGEPLTELRLDRRQIPEHRRDLEHGEHLARRAESDVIPHFAIAPALPLPRPHARSARPHLRPAPRTCT